MNVLKCVSFVLVSFIITLPITLPVLAEDIRCIWADNDAPGDPVFISRLIGTEWSTERFPPSSPFSGNSAPCLGADPDGRLWAVWAARKGEAAPQIVFSRGLGNRWTIARPVVSRAGWDSFPAIAVDPNGLTGVAWSREEEGDISIFFARWNGVSFRPEIPVSDPDASPDVRPALAFDASGRLLILWQGFEDGYYQICWRVIEDGKRSEEKLLSPRPAIDQVCPSVFVGEDGVFTAGWLEEGVAVESRWEDGAWTAPEAAAGRGSGAPPLPASDEDSWMLEFQGGRMASYRSIFFQPRAGFRETVARLAGKNAASSKVYTGFGDSITYGTTPPGYNGCYIPLLLTLLRTAYPADTFTIYNAGYPGARTDQLLSGGGDWGCPGINSVIDNTHCEKILIMGGTNDVTHDYSPAYTQSNLGTMIDRARARNCEPVLSTILPICYHSSDNAAVTVLDLNYIHPLATDKACQLADPWAEYQLYGDYCELLVDDGVHPVYPDGSQPIAEAWFDAIVVQTPPLATPTPTAPIPTPTAPTPTAAPTPVIHVLDSGDYDGDGTSDFAIFRQGEGSWTVRNLTKAYFGNPGDDPASGDYNGDGTTDIAVFRAGSGFWGVRNLTRVFFGSLGDAPVPGDYNGDGSCDFGVFRGSANLWAFRDLTRAYYGLAGDLPVPSYYNDDRTKDIAIFRPANGLWAVRNLTQVYFGEAGDRPLPGDYSGKRSDDAAIFRRSASLWCVRDVTRCNYGLAADYPAGGDFNGDGSADIAVYRPSEGRWAVSGVTSCYFGLAGDIPVSARPPRRP